jgi:hypothetical protein
VRKVVGAVLKVVRTVLKVVGGALKVVCFPETTPVFLVNGNSGDLLFIFPGPRLGLWRKG